MTNVIFPHIFPSLSYIRRGAAGDEKNHPPAAKEKKRKNKEATNV